MSAPIVKKNNKEVSINGDDNVKGIMESVFGDVSKSSATKQLVIGGASGWATGFITMRVGKIAAFAIGGGIILLQVANHQGYIKVNWDKLYKHLDKVADKVEEKATGEGPKWMEKICDFARQNSYTAAGFAGGFFLGIASS